MMNMPAKLFSSFMAYLRKEKVDIVHHHHQQHHHNILTCGCKFHFISIPLLRSDKYLRRGGGAFGHLNELLEGPLRLIRWAPFCNFGQSCVVSAI